MASEEAAGLQHGELEEQLDVRGRELLRQLFQDRLDATAAVRSGGMTWPGKTAWCARARKRQGTAASDEVRAGHGIADRLPVAWQAECAPG